MAGTYFTQDTLNFLAALAANNQRDWFNAHKQDYEARVRTPALNFIHDIAPALQLISPHFLALPKKVGGALMRVQRDIRFGTDKRPYKTNIGIQFRHEVGKDVHAPGFYLHIEPGNCFLGVGLWRPDSAALGKIRDALVERDDAWRLTRDDPAFNRHFSLAGDSLKNPPRGYAKEHPLLQDIKRKDFIAIAPLRDAALISTKSSATVLEHYAAATPFMRYLCQALALRF